MSKHWKKIVSSVLVWSMLSSVVPFGYASSEIGSSTSLDALKARSERVRALLEEDPEVSEAKLQRLKTIYDAHRKYRN